MKKDVIEFINLSMNLKEEDPGAFYNFKQYMYTLTLIENKEDKNRLINIISSMARSYMAESNRRYKDIEEA